PLRPTRTSSIPSLETNCSCVLTTSSTRGEYLSKSRYVIIAAMSDNAKLNYYLAAWDLSHPQLLAQTVTSDIYTVTRGAETAVLKLLSPSETEEQSGALALRYFDGHGAVRLLRFDQGAHLLEYAAGDELVTLVERGQDESATRIIAQVIEQLHSVPQDTPHDGLFVLDRWFGDLFNKAVAD